MMNTKKKLSEFQEKEVVNLYIDGTPATKIAKMFNVSSTPIYAILDKFKISRRNNSKARQVYPIDENYFEEINSHAKAYVLGLFYTDGNNFLRRNRIALGLNDLDVIEFVRSELCSNRPIYKINKSKNTHYRLDIVNKKLSNDLAKLGCSGNKTYTLSFPNEKIVPKEFLSSFLLGLFDGDGCLCKSKGNSFLFCFLGTLSMSVGFSKSIELLVGEELSLTVCKNSKHLYYAGTYKKLKIIKIMDFLYKSTAFSMKRKRDFYFNYIKNDAILHI